MNASRIDRIQEETTKASDELDTVLKRLDDEFMMDEARYLVGLVRSRLAVIEQYAKEVEGESMMAEGANEELSLACPNCHHRPLDWLDEVLMVCSQCLWKGVIENGTD